VDFKLGHYRNAHFCCRPAVRLVLPEQFFSVFNKADDHDYGRSCQADKKHDLKHPHCENFQQHVFDCNPVLHNRRRVRNSLLPKCFKLGPV